MLRHGEPERAALAERADRQRVSGAADRGELGMRGDERARGAAAREDALRHLLDVARRGGDAALVEAIEDALEARGDPVVEARRRGDDAELAMAEIDEVARQIEGAAAGVEAD